MRPSAWLGSTSASGTAPGSSTRESCPRASRRRADASSTTSADSSGTPSSFAISAGAPAPSATATRTGPRESFRNASPRNSEVTTGKMNVQNSTSGCRINMRSRINTNWPRAFIRPPSLPRTRAGSGPSCR